MRCITAPGPFDGVGPSLFLAGGITGCADWQAEAVTALSDCDVTVLNPRRAAYRDDPAEAGVQIRWEHQMLRAADLILFWFPHETLCPIALFELGAVSVSGERAVVGTDPGYARRYDVVTQLAVARPGLVVADSLSDTLAAARHQLGC